MTLYIGKNRKKSLDKTQKGDKWYPYVKQRTTITEEKVAELVTERTPLDPNLARMVLSNFKKIVMEKVLDGNTVMLGDLGYFYATVSGEPSDTKEEVNRQKIKRVKMHFKFSKKAEKEMQEIDFTFLEELMHVPTKEEKYGSKKSADTNKED